jgi:hypothetical protein
MPAFREHRYKHWFGVRVGLGLSAKERDVLLAERQVLSHELIEGIELPRIGFDETNMGHRG